MSQVSLDDVVIKRRAGNLTRADLMKMDPVGLRALFRERIHHTIEVEIYPILLGRKPRPEEFGLQPELVLDVWRARGFSDKGDDFEWGQKYLDLASEMRAGRKVEIQGEIPKAFTDEEMAVVRKLLWGRCSVRDWVQGKPVPDEMIEQILEAGRAAPTGCNLSPARFVVIKDPEEARMVWSDIPTPIDQCVLIVICYDRRPYEAVGQINLVSHNMMLDAAAAADHMLLMAHALGLGGVWLTCLENTAKTFHERYGLPESVSQALHLAIGWPAMTSIKSLRMPLSEMMLARSK